jgi:hypothetical protein
MLTTALSGLLEAGFGMRTEVVERAWAQLQAQQQPDGSFEASDETESAANITLIALDIARRIDAGSDGDDDR